MTRGDRTFSLVIDRSVESSKTHKSIFQSTGSPIKDYEYSYTISPSINGMVGETIEIKYKSTENKSGPYDNHIDLQQGLSESEHKVILSELAKYNSNLAQVWKEYIPNSVDMKTKNINNRFWKELSEFINNKQNY